METFSATVDGCNFIAVNIARGDVAFKTVGVNQLTIVNPPSLMRV